MPPADQDKNDKGEELPTPRLLPSSPPSINYQPLGHGPVGSGSKVPSELNRILLPPYVIGVTDVSALDDREYREAQLAAGLVEGRLHLLAYALGAGASGMTFLDSEVPGLLGERVDTLLFTCVGVPEYRSKRGGLPGAPSEFRQVTPRIDDEA